MKLMPDGKLVTLEELPAGALFSFGGEIVLKSEYTTEKGLIEAFILGSGELFCGGCPIEEQPQLKVQPLKLIKNTEEAKPTSGDFISRKDVMDYLREQQANVIIEKNKAEGFVAAVEGEAKLSEVDKFINFIVQCPTAYDTGKVVEEVSDYLLRLVGKNAQLYKTVIGKIKEGGERGIKNQ